MTVGGASSEKALELLGWRPRPIDETILDTAAGLARLGLLRDDAVVRTHTHRWMKCSQAEETDVSAGGVPDMTNNGSGPEPAVMRAEKMVAAVRDSPEDRLRLAADFYDQRIGGRSIRPYRRAEIAFMRWQVRCGVLRAVGGSPWWRAVNASLLRDAAEAYALFNGAPGEASSQSVTFWLAFLHSPAPERWYRAHNASIVGGYLRHRGLVDGEGPLERFFMDVALVRVLYAHCLLVRPRLALGRLAPLGGLLGDPRRRGANLFLSLKDVLPDAYPLSKVGIEKVLADENYLSRVMDYGIIAPRIPQLYRHAAEDLAEPDVAGLCNGEFPVYAWPYEQRHVWRTDRSPIGVAVARAVIGPVSGTSGR